MKFNCVLCLQEGAASPEVLEAYMKLEQAIWREEQEAPAPAPAHSFATSRLEALTDELMSAEDRAASWASSGRGAGTDESLRQVVLELGIHRNEKRSVEHEEFIANINRQVGKQANIDREVRKKDNINRQIGQQDNIDRQVRKQDNINRQVRQ